MLEGLKVLVTIGLGITAVPLVLSMVILIAFWATRKYAKFQVTQKNEWLIELINAGLLIIFWGLDFINSLLAGDVWTLCLSLLMFIIACVLFVAIKATRPAIQQEKEGNDV